MVHYYWNPSSILVFFLFYTLTADVANQWTFDNRCHPSKRIQTNNFPFLYPTKSRFRYVVMHVRSYLVKLQTWDKYLYCLRLPYVFYKVRFIIDQILLLEIICSTNLSSIELEVLYNDLFLWSTILFIFFRKQLIGIEKYSQPMYVRNDDQFFVAFAFGHATPYRLGKQTFPVLKLKDIHDLEWISTQCMVMHTSEEKYSMKPFRHVLHIIIS